MGENEDEVPLNLPEPPVTYKVRINHRYLLPKSNLKSDSFIASVFCVSTRRSIITVWINASNGKLNIVLLHFWCLFLKIFISNSKAQYSLKSDIEYTKT